MEIILIAALSRNFVIGKDNKLPWHYSEDLKHFKELTKGHPVIMGRKTFESLGSKPLPHRLNIILTRNAEMKKLFEIKECIVLDSLERVISYCKERDLEKIFVIGGEYVYKEALPKATAMELTLINKDAEGDAFFPEWNKKEWKEFSRRDLIDKKTGDVFSFVRFERI